MKTRFRLTSICCVASAFLLFVSSEAQASYIVTMQQVGPDVLATGSGPIDLTGLTFVRATRDFSYIAPGSGNIVTGTFAAFIDDYTGFSGPTNFGSGPLSFGLNGGGDLVGIVAFNGDLLVPTGYISGTPLGPSTATWNNATFASLGVIPGTYVWTWGSGEHADSFTLQIGVPDSGSTFGLLFLGLLGLVGASRFRSFRLT